MKKSKKDCKTTNTWQFYDLYKKDKSHRLTKLLALYFASNSGSFSEELTKLICTDDYLAILDFRINYSDYNLCDLNDIRNARQCLSLYNKNADLSITDVDKSRNCLTSFAKTELQCRETNERLFAFFETHNINFMSETHDFVCVARKISQILGDCPTLDSLPWSFGPGSAVCNTGIIKTLQEKLSVDPACSSSFYISPYINELVETLPLYWTYHHVNETVIVRGKYGQVPKNAKTERTIETQPLLNLPTQKGVGSAIRKELLRWGCDLNDQSRNQSLALLGSADNTVVTLDVQNASNTVSIAAVYFCLIFCQDWFDLLWSLRSESIDIHGHSYPLETFSTMGNGYTFELESLIFYAIALTMTAKVDGDTSLVSVYGDDIIVPIAAYPGVLDALSFFGFVVNVDKTFTDGPFRESCGKDYFFGKNVRPFYVKDRFTDARIVALLNHDTRHYNLLDDSIRSQLLAEMCSENVLCGFDGLGDGHIIMSPQAQNYLLDYFKVHNDDGLVDLFIKPIGNVNVFDKQHLVEWPESSDPFWFVHSTKKDRRKYSRSSRDGHEFASIIKLPARDDVSWLKANQLLPYYSVGLLPQLSVLDMNDYATEISISQRVFITPLCNKIQWSQTESVYDKLGMNVLQVVKSGPAENDPYVIRGGWKEKAITIYTTY